MASPSSAAALRAPFPYFGGKSRAAHLVWEALGDVASYVEPFCGSAAVLLARPHAPRVETINDADGMVANFWRAVATDPGAVAHHADWPVNEADLHARHRWLIGQRESLTERLIADPAWFDARVAGWWCWGACAWIGDGWCSAESRKIPNVDGHGGKGVHALGGFGPESFTALAKRLRRVRVACGDWQRVLGGSALRAHGGACGVFLDPPYAEGDMDYAAGGTGISADVRQWAIEHGADRALRIVLAGYEGEHPMPAGWRAVEWTAGRGFSGAENTNRRRERLWLSPHCEGARQLSLLDAGGAS